MYKTHTCGELRKTHAAETVKLAGWIHRRRDHGDLIFIDLRDRSGLVQVVYDPDLPDVFATAEQVRNEFVVRVKGRVRARPELRNLVREAELSVNDLIWPIFVRDGTGIEEPVTSLPGVIRRSVDRIVEADVPFRIEERRARVVRLRDMMDQADVTTSEKYRRVMEAYQGELEYGRTTEAYSATLPGTEQTVDFLRVGRTLLVYQSSDGSRTGWFNRDTRAFEELNDDRFRMEVRNGLAIARNITDATITVCDIDDAKLEAAKALGADNIVNNDESCDPPGSTPDPRYPNNECRDDCTYCGFNRDAVPGIARGSGSSNDCCVPSGAHMGPWK